MPYRALPTGARNLPRGRSPGRRRTPHTSDPPPPTPGSPQTRKGRPDVYSQSNIFVPGRGGRRPVRADRHAPRRRRRIADIQRTIPHHRIGNACSAGGTEEIIQLSGTLHVASTSVEDGSGGYHVTSHANWQGVEGVNEATGEKFRVISAGKSTFDTKGGLPFTSTRTVHNNLVGQGFGGVMIMQNTYHITVNAGGGLVPSSRISRRSAGTDSTNLQPLGWVPPPRL